MIAVKWSVWMPVVKFDMEKYIALVWYRIAGIDIEDSDRGCRYRDAEANCQDHQGRQCGVAAQTLERQAKEINKHHHSPLINSLRSRARPARR